MATDAHRQRSIPDFMRGPLERMASAAATRPATLPAPGPLSALERSMGRQAAPVSASGGYRRLDGEARLSAAQLCTELDWAAGTLLRARPTPAGYLLERSEHRGGRGSLTGAVDANRRIRLPKAVRDELDPTGAGHIYVRRHGEHLELYPTALIDELLDAHLTHTTTQPRKDPS